MKFLLIYNIFYSMWYAEHVMNNEYLQTDGIEGRECWLVEQCSHFFWPYLSQALTGNENTSTQTALPFLFYIHICTN